MSRLRLTSAFFTLPLAMLLPGGLPLSAQGTLTESQFVDSVSTAVDSLISSLPSNPTHKFVFTSSLVAAYGDRVRNQTLTSVLQYIDGLKAAGTQRISFNPNASLMTDPKQANTVAMYDAIVRHIRELGLSLSLDPEYEPAVDPSITDFSQFAALAAANYPLMAARYQPDVFVLVHEPTTMTGRMNIAGSISITDWHNFLLSTIPLVKSSAPQALIEAGCSYDTFSSEGTAEKENEFYDDWVTIPGLDVMTMDIFTTYFNVFTQWAQLAQQNNKGVSIQASWAPHYLPPTRPPGTQGENLDDLSLVGPANAAFAPMDISWLNAIFMFASAYNMVSATAYTTETFFVYGTSGSDKPDQGSYWNSMVQAIAAGTLTGTAQAFLADAQKWGIPTLTSLSSASYATLPTVFNPTCGTSANPCNPQTIAAPDALISAFGADLGTTAVTDGTFPDTLGGTTMMLVDSTNTPYPVQMFSVSPTQVNYYVPSKVAIGPVTLTVTSADGTVTTGWALVDEVMPALYTANSNGQGPASAIAVCTGVCNNWPIPIGAGQFYQYAFNCNSSGCTPTPIPLASTDTVVLELFGTGLRHLTDNSDITAQVVNGPALPVAFVGPQGDTGLDQVNITLPQSLSGSGTIQLMLTVQDTVANLTKNSNIVQIAIQ